MIRVRWMDSYHLVVDDLTMLSHACIQVVNKSKLDRKWDWYDQTACLAAAAAQEVPEDQDQSRDHHKYRTLTRKPKHTISKKQQQPNEQAKATKFYETHTKGRQRFYKDIGTRIK